MNDIFADRTMAFIRQFMRDERRNFRELFKSRNEILFCLLTGKPQLRKYYNDKINLSFGLFATTKIISDYTQISFNVAASQYKRKMTMKIFYGFLDMNK